MATTSEPCLCGDPGCGRCFAQPGDDRMGDRREEVIETDEFFNLRIQQLDAGWCVWLFDAMRPTDAQIAIGIGTSRDAAVGQAVRVVEALEQALQGPPPAGQQ